jgi:hypothetical protein
MADESLLISIEHSPASDSWGFVGRVLVGDHECYRTLRAYSTPTEALAVTKELVGDVLGGLLAGQEWRTLSEQLGHAPTRAELALGLTARTRRHLEGADKSRSGDQSAAPDGS